MISHFVVPSPSRTKERDGEGGLIEMKRSLLLHMCFVAPLSTTKVIREVAGCEGETTELFVDFG